MPHAHRLELRIVVPRHAPLRIELDAQDVIVAESDHRCDLAPRQPDEARVAMRV